MRRVSTVIVLVLVAAGCSSTPKPASTSPTVESGSKKPAANKVAPPPVAKFSDPALSFYTASVLKGWLPSMLVDKHEFPGRRHWLVVDLLLRREFLARVAEAANVTITDRQIRNKLAAGEIYALGERRPGKVWYFRSGGTSPTFDPTALQRVSEMLGLSYERDLLDEQRRELLAQHTIAEIGKRVRVSDAAVEREYEKESTKAVLDFVAFMPRRYGRTPFLERNSAKRSWGRYVWLTRAEVDSYLKRHETAVKKRYRLDARTKYAARPRVLARYMFIARSVRDGADPRRANARALRKQLAGGADFAKLARSYSEDIYSNYRGGLLRWRDVGHLGRGAKLSAAARKLAVGELSPVIEDRRGYHIVRIEQRSSKALTYAQVKYELAEKLARGFYRTRQAEIDAGRVLARVRAGHKLAGGFARGRGVGRPGPQVTPELLTRLRALPPAQRATMLRMLLARAKTDKSGWQPVAPRPAKHAKARPAPLPNAPVLRTQEVPKVHSYGPFTREPGFGGPLSSARLTTVFDTQRDGTPPPRVYRHNGAFVVVQVTHRIDPDPKQFAVEKPLIRERLDRLARDRRVYQWVKRRCRAYARAHPVELRRQLERVRQLLSEPKPTETYTPCATLADPD